MTSLSTKHVTKSIMAAKISLQSSQASSSKTSYSNDQKRRNSSAHTMGQLVLIISPRLHKILILFKLEMIDLSKSFPTTGHMPYLVKKRRSYACYTEAGSVQVATATRSRIGRDDLLHQMTPMFRECELGAT